MNAQMHVFAFGSIGAFGCGACDRHYLQTCRTQAYQGVSTTADSKYNGLEVQQSIRCLRPRSISPATARPLRHCAFHAALLGSVQLRLARVCEKSFVTAASTTGGTSSSRQAQDLQCCRGAAVRRDIGRCTTPKRHQPAAATHSLAYQRVNICMRRPPCLSVLPSLAGHHSSLTAHACRSKPP